jgi:hypothetical protein
LRRSLGRNARNLASVPASLTKLYIQLNLLFTYCFDSLIAHEVLASVCLKQAREPDGLRRGGRRAAEITARVYNTWAHQIACSARQVLSEHAAQSAPDRARAFSRNVAGLPFHCDVGLKSRHFDFVFRCFPLVQLTRVCAWNYPQARKIDFEMARGSLERSRPNIRARYLMALTQNCLPSDL